VGVVTSGTHSPSLGEPIGVGYVPANLAALGSTFDVVIRDKAVPAVVVKTPFLQRA
jgi:aminomethyltransferase